MDKYFSPSFYESCVKPNMLVILVIKITFSVALGLIGDVRFLSIPQ